MTCENEAFGSQKPRRRTFWACEQLDGRVRSSPHGPKMARTGWASPPDRRSQRNDGPVGALGAENESLFIFFHRVSSILEPFRLFFGGADLVFRLLSGVQCHRGALTPVARALAGTGRCGSSRRMHVACRFGARRASHEGVWLDFRSECLEIGGLEHHWKLFRGFKDASRARRSRSMDS